MIALMSSSNIFENPSNEARYVTSNEVLDNSLKSYNDGGINENWLWNASFNAKTSFINFNHLTLSILCKKDISNLYERPFKNKNREFARFIYHRAMLNARVLFCNAYVLYYSARYVTTLVIAYSHMVGYVISCLFKLLKSLLKIIHECVNAPVPFYMSK